MLFNSLHFVIFFLVVWGLVALLRKHVVARNVMLLVAGYYFYAWWDWRFLSLLWLTTLFDYFCGRMLRVENHVPGTPLARPKRDRMFLAASMALNLTILGFFKYFNFFVTSAESLLSSMGMHPHVTTLQIILPLGISFYTFQSMNYVIDVYRGELEGEKSLLNFALFVSFFPHLVAGPILRATALMPQIKQPSAITWPGVYTGFYLVMWGLFKKVVIADNVARVADEVFRAFPASFAQVLPGASLPPGGSVMFGVYAFAIQIYCDFSGYTDVARGTARMMGFELMRNFNLPYFATNPTEFWRRWHISLSSWLRDYLYIPLGGNRKGTRRTYINLMITMLLGGLWHGAAWTFVIWGAYHGLLLCVHHAGRGWLERTFAPKSAFQKRLWTIVRIIIFFHIVCFGWLLFRAVSMEQVWLMSKAVIMTLAHSNLSGALNQTLLFSAVILFAVQIAQATTKEHLVGLKLPVPLRAVAYAAIFLGIVIFGETGGRSFIYFQF
jgi:D-alanyl-lipoteichoic acid acyltransferase DltB (MBOAT superfamily)